MNLPDNILEKKYAVYIRETTKKAKAYTNWAWLFSAKVMKFCQLGMLNGSI